MMKRLNGMTGIPFICALVLMTGCAITPERRPVDYQVNLDRVSEGPPAPIQVAPSDKGSDVVMDEIKIQPEKSVGYDNLPTTVTQIFDTTPIQLSLGDVITETMANSRLIKIQDYTMRIADAEIPASKGIYDLLMTANLQFNRTENQDGVMDPFDDMVNGSRTRSAGMGLQQLLPSGGFLSLGYNLMRQSSSSSGLSSGSSSIFSTSSKYYGNDTSLGITQPLLRGFGPSVTNASIRIAQFDNQIAAADFQTTVENMITNTLSLYWELIGSIEFYKVKMISYSAAKDLLRINKAKYDAGVLPATDVLQAEAAMQARREEMINARRDIRDLEDSLKREIFLQAETPQWETQILPTQAFAWREIDVNMDEAIEIAMARRAELRSAQGMIEKAQVNLDVTKNSLLPAVNLFGEVTPNGIGTGTDEAFRTMRGTDYTNYTAGIEFSYPLQNRTARYRHRQAQLGKQLSEEAKRDTEDTIVQELRSAIRNLRTSRERIDVTSSQVRSEEAKLSSEMKRYEVGISTAFEVLTFQEDLANAQVQHLRSVVDYNKAAIQLDRARGTLLETYGIQVIDDLSPEAEPIGFPVGMN